MKFVLERSQLPLEFDLILQSGVIPALQQHLLMPLQPTVCTSIKHVIDC